MNLKALYFIFKTFFSVRKKLFRVFIIIIMSLTEPPAENQARPGSEEGLSELRGYKS